MKLLYFHDPCVSNKGRIYVKIRDIVKHCLLDEAIFQYVIGMTNPVIS